MRRRHRHRPYQLEYARARKRAGRPILAFVIVGGLLLISAWWLIGKFGFGGTSQRAAVLLSPEERGIVRISLDGDDWKQTDQEIKLYPGDRIATNANTNASLSFFDGTFVRLDEHTTVHIIESKRREEEESKIAVHLEDGTLWIATPAKSVFKKPISRHVSTAMLNVSLMPETEVVVKGQSLIMFDSDGIGSTVDVAGANDPVIVGEGQIFAIPEGQTDVSGDLYAFRSALDPRAVLSSFVDGSKTSFHAYRQIENEEEEEEETPIITDGELLEIIEPQNQETLQTSTVEVRGNINPERIVDVQVNGYGAEINENTGAFYIEIALPDEDETDITVVAIDKNGEVLEEAVRTVLRDREPPEPPTFLTPAKTGETYQTQRTKLEVTGKAPEDAVGIIVNDYRLQLFQPGDDTWSYLANVEYDNFQSGENIFTAIAINRGGYRSEPVTMTVVLGGKTEGVIKEAKIEESEETDESPEEEPEVLPSNAPLMPGTIQIISPTPGTEHEAKGINEIEILIEGTVPEATASVWVNDYRLQLFKKGATSWNYIASTELRTMKRGRNAYEVIARNSEGKVLDRLTYTIRFDPRG